MSKLESAKNWMALIGAIVCIMALLRFNGMLQNNTAKSGYFSLELASSPKEVKSIVNSWEEVTLDVGIDIESEECNNLAPGEIESYSVLKQAKNFTLLSLVLWIFLGVFFHSLLAAKVNVFSRRKEPKLFPLVIGVIIIDLAEKFIIYKMLDGQLYHLAMIKWILFSIKALGISIVLIEILRKYYARLRKILRSVGRWLGAMWFARLSVIVLLLMYLLLFAVGQGQDLLLTIPSGGTSWSIVFGVLSFYFSVMMLAWLNWFLPRWNILRKKTRNKELNRNPSDHEIVEYIEGKVSKIGDATYIAEMWQDTFKWLGAMTFLIAGAAAYEVSNVANVGGGFFYAPGAGTLFMLVIGAAYFYILRANFIKKLSDKAKRFVTIAAALLVPLVLLLTHFLNDGSNRGLKLLSLGVFLLSILFLLFTSVKSAPKKAPEAAANKLANTVEEIRDTLVHWIERRKAFRWVMYPAVAYALWFLVNQFFPGLIPPKFSVPQFALFNVFAAITFYILVISFIPIIFSKRHGFFAQIKQTSLLGLLQLFVVAMLLVALLPSNAKFHDVKTVPVNKNQIPTIEEHMALWLADRAQKIEADGSLLNQENKYPIFLVNSHGGGIAAAAWTNLVLSSLEQLSGETDFGEHIYSLSGASGGTVGSAVYVAFRKEKEFYENQYKPGMLYRSGFFSEDYLSPVVTALLGRDIFLKPTEVADRSDIQERLWARRLRKMTGSKKPYANMPMTALWNNNSQFDLDVPLLFSNTYMVEKGQKGIAAPVQLQEKTFPGAVYINDLTDTTQVTLMSGTFMSARFPYMSPAGRIKDGFSFFDGGMKDNSGGQTSSQIVNTLRPIVDSLNATLPYNFTINVISIRHFPQAEEIRQKKSKSAPLTPVSALVNNMYGTTRLSEIQNQRGVGCDNYFSFHHFSKEVGFNVNKSFRQSDSSGNYVKVRPTIPLGWTISRPAVCRYVCSLMENPDSVNGILESLGNNATGYNSMVKQGVKVADCQCLTE